MFAGANRARPASDIDIQFSQGPVNSAADRKAWLKRQRYKSALGIGAKACTDSANYLPRLVSLPSESVGEFERVQRFDNDVIARYRLAKA